MNRTLSPWLLAAAFAAGFAISPDVPAQASAAPAEFRGPVSDAPPLSPAQAREVQAQLDAYRRDVELRLAQGSITPDEAQRLLAWRQYQLALQATGEAAPSQILDLQARADAERAAMAAAFAPAAVPPSAWVIRPSICAGRWGGSWGGSVCF